MRIRADNRDADAVASAVDATIDAFGPIDILVDNAGIIDARPINEFTLEDFTRMVDANVQAAFVTTQKAVAQMSESGGVITIGSNLAKRAPFPGMSLYSLSQGRACWIYPLIGPRARAARDSR